MKLLSKYYRINISATIVVMLISSVCYYFLLHDALVEQLDNALKVEEQEIKDYVNKTNTLPDPSSYEHQIVIFETAENNERKFSTVNLYNREAKEHERTRQLVFPVKVNTKLYKARILKSQEETEDLIQLILIITLIVVVLLLIIIFLVNRFLLNNLWKPFNSALYHLKQFKLKDRSALRLEQSSIDEFKDLNQAVRAMVEQVNQEYDALKIFTENASHEMQTPLAIINSKLDVLIQDDNISEQQTEQLEGIYHALDRLTKLNSSLLLLTRIDNNQFKEVQNLALDEIIIEKLLQFEDLIASRKLHVTTQLNSLTIHCNRQLLDILLTNLLNNAIRYNHAEGTVLVRLSKSAMVISNSSNLPALDAKQVFQRFYRHPDTKQDGNGLGLSIVKQICYDSGFSIEYLFLNDHHEFHVHF